VFTPRQVCNLLDFRLNIPKEPVQFSVRYESEQRKWMGLRINSVIYTFHFESCKIKTRVENAFETISRVLDIVPAEYETHKIAEFVPTEFEFLPHLQR
jgi:hypothetical protein